MILQKLNNLGGMLMAVKLRKAGEMNRDGKLLTWNERWQLVIMPFEAQTEREIRKYCISPKYQDAILKGLEQIHWGCMVDLELEDKEVVNVTIVDDVLADFYEVKL